VTEPTQLTDDEEVLLRQVHPTHLKHDGTLSAQAFCPTPRDKGMLSTLRGDVGAEQAHQRWTSAGRESLGTWGVSVYEVHEVRITNPDNPSTPWELRAVDDAEAIGVEDHASIDFTELPSPGKMRQAARKLLEAATDRGALHP
jgi:hypothetical protein